MLFIFTCKKSLLSKKVTQQNLINLFSAADTMGTKDELGRKDTERCSMYFKIVQKLKIIAEFDFLHRVTILQFISSLIVAVE